jgi:hypothetical protein
MSTATAGRSTVELLVDLHLKTAEAIGRIDQELGLLG